MSKEQHVTNKINAENHDLEILKQHFPHCFDKNGDFQFDKFKENLTEKEVNFSKESYSLEWLGKSYARLRACDPATTLLKADETHNLKTENINSQNLLIKGDNLEVLKHLSSAYYEKVKMIYIDPPYNTGNDGFVYEDDRKYTLKELQKLTGVDEERAKRILEFTRSKSNSHSAWLTFMYPRLYIAKQLLKDDGVIFVSIDDNEVAQLRLLMDEVFGEENFVANVIWNSTKSVTNTALISVSHTYNLIYSKNIEYFIENRNEFRLPDDGVGFENPDNDPRGAWKADPFQVGGWRPNQQYEIKNPNTGKIYKPNPECSWKNDYDKFLELLADNRIVFGKTGTSGPQRKRFIWEAEERGKVTKTLWDDVETTTNGTQLVKKMFDDNNVFDNPKPTGLIKKILQLSTNKSSVILDFFAGSGTTAHAVMQLNAEDGGNRKFILVQIPEPIDSSKNQVAYDFVTNELKKEATIFEITKERILRASKKINAELDEKIARLKGELLKEENKSKIEKLEKCKNQNNFKIFETIPIWEDYEFEAEEFDSSLELFDVGKLSKDDVKALLTTWKTYDGIPLTQDLEEIKLHEYTAYYANGKLYLMNKGFTSESLKALLEKIDTDKNFEPRTIIAFGFHKESKSLREISENVKTYNNKKKTDIEFITRY